MTEEEQSKALLKRVRRLELKTKGLSSQLFSGTYRTKFKGRGMSFAEVRPYQYGDDVRSIDWNVTARTHTPHVKVFEEERELSFMLLIDVSRSTWFGTTAQSKADLLVELAATLAFSAISNNDRVGLLFFAEGVERYVPPRKGQNHILRIIRALLTLEPKAGATNLSEALRQLNNLTKRRNTVFILSDFWARDYEAALKVTAARHDLIGLAVEDPREAQLPAVGWLPMRDLETGASTWVNTDDASFRAAYAEQYAAHFRDLEQVFGRTGADFLRLRCGEPYMQDLIRFFDRRMAW